jgi:hypothetical protein
MFEAPNTKNFKQELKRTSFKEVYFWKCPPFRI